MNHNFATMKGVCRIYASPFVLFFRFLIMCSLFMHAPLSLSNITIRRAFNLSDVKLYKVKDHLALPSVHLHSLKLEAD